MKSNHTKIIFAIFMFAVSCVLAGSPAGRIVAWGFNTEGSVTGIPYPGSSIGFVRVDGQLLTNVVMIAAGRMRSYAVQSDGKVVTWGFKGPPVPPDLTNPSAISVGEFHDLALREDGTVVAWGGLGGAEVPVGLSNVIAISAGLGQSLAIRQDGTLVNWGESMELPNGLTNLVAVTVCGSPAGEDFVLKRDGTVAGWCCQGRGDTPAAPPPGLSNIVAIAAGNAHCLALRTDHTVVAWGDRNNGVNNPQFGQTDVPAGLTNVVAISACGNTSMALKGDGRIVVWGDNTHHQVDLAVGLSNIAAIAAGGDYCMAIQTNGTVTESNIFLLPEGVHNPNIEKLVKEMYPQYVPK